MIIRLQRTLDENIELGKGSLDGYIIGRGIWYMWWCMAFVFRFTPWLYGVPFNQVSLNLFYNLWMCCMPTFSFTLEFLFYKSMLIRLIMYPCFFCWFLPWLLLFHLLSAKNSNLKFSDYTRRRIKDISLFYRDYYILALCLGFETQISHLSITPYISS